MGLMGATVGLTLGLASGLVRKSPRSGALAALLGLVLGAAAGSGAAVVGVPLASRLHDWDPGNMSVEMASSLLMHGIPWAVIGAVGGLAYGWGLGGRVLAIRGLLAGLFGGVAGAFLYEIVGALALPDAKIIEPVAVSWGVRLLAQLVAVLATAAAVAALVPVPTNR
jgi:hypothetical protein